MCVKREDFKTCDQSSFCIRQRSYGDLVKKTEAVSPYNVLLNSLTYEKSKGLIKAEVVNTNENVLFNLELLMLTSGSVRMRFEEKENPVSKVRFDVSKFALENEPSYVNNYDVTTKDNEIVVTFGEEKNLTTMILQLSPLKVELIKDNESLINFNQRGYFNYEYHRVKNNEAPVNENEKNNDSEVVKEENNEEPIVMEEDQEEVVVAKDDKEENANENSEEKVNETMSEEQKAINDLKEKTTKDMWTETFKKFTDSKPYGPESIGFDLSFPGFKNVYGIPQHSSPLNLKTTKNGDEYNEPYRLFNLDVFEYEIDNPMALYGSVPFMIAHKKNHSSGILFINASEMWIDVEKDETSTQTHWMAESGQFDVILFVGRDSKDIIKQYTDISGKPTLPQSFAIAYHQCRWNYIDEADVESVDANFDKYEIPYDVLWLDIEHTDGKRYFTWDYTKFPNPEEMQKKLAIKGRKMVTIVDPHIKVDNEYFVYKNAKDMDYFVHNNENKLYDGWCWPGSSSWIDYLNPEASQWVSELYKFSNYKGSTETLYTWIDMNEPSVFSGPETTMPKDNLHFGNIEHRDIHNIYGELYHKTTYNGHLLRRDNQDRPFILTRSFFIGTQRYGAIWTGDNDASWTHLKASLPMILSISISGIPFTGADVGGFFNNPNEELLARWYQAAAFQPFFRAHSHIDTKRREPWLFSDNIIENIRNSISYRYILLPFWYTLFREASLTGVPPARPMFLEFPDNEACYNMDEQYMLGDALLIKPVVNEGQKETTVYLPSSSIWYNYQTFETINLNGEENYTMETPLDVIPVFIRGGSIIPQRQRLRRSSTLMKHDPFTLLIALNEKGEASGKLYVDDGETFKYKEGEYISRSFNYSNHVLTSTIDLSAELPTGYAQETKNDQILTDLSQRIERIVILGKNLSQVKSVQLVNKDNTVQSLFFEITPVKEGGESLLTIKNPAVQIKDVQWKIQVLFE